MTKKLKYCGIRPGIRRWNQKLTTRSNFVCFCYQLPAFFVICFSVWLFFSGSHQGGSHQQHLLLFKPNTFLRVICHLGIRGKRFWTNLAPVAHFEVQERKTKRKLFASLSWKVIPIPHCFHEHQLWTMSSRDLWWSHFWQCRCTDLGNGM